MTGGPIEAEGAPVVVRGVTKRYSRSIRGEGDVVHALDDLDLVVAEGTAVGVIGPNGAGKTTLLRVLSGITVPDEGTVVRRGRTASVIELGLGLHPELTGDENLELAGALLGLPRARVRERRSEIVGFAGLGDDMGRVVKHYSTGMMARLSLAIALHVDAELLLLDEVMSVGDLAFRQACTERLQLLRAEGATIVLVTHDLALMASVCERAVLIDRGRSIDDGPASIVAARYLGQPEQVVSAIGRVALEAVTPRVPAGDELELRARIDLEHDWRSVEAKLELGLPHADPTAGQEMMAYASAPIPVAWRGAGTYHLDLRMRTDFFPVGSFLVRLHVGAESGLDPATATVPVAITASGERRMRMQLPAEVSVRGREVGAR